MFCEAIGKGLESMELLIDPVTEESPGVQLEFASNICGRHNNAPVPHLNNAEVQGWAIRDRELPTR